MTLRIHLLWVCCVLAACGRSDTSPPLRTTFTGDAFYVWQRDWRPAVRAAASVETGDLYLLTAEADVANGTFTETVIAVNWASCAKARSVTAVYRLHVRCLGHSDTIGWLERRLGALPKTVHGVQLDLDCPERRLDEYVEMVKAVRLKLRKGVSLSVTVLPCHLTNRTFADLANAVDWFVVQVHGLEAPKHVDDDCRLMRPSIARTAIRRAKALGRPFKVALPTYGYRLFFSKTTGEFKRIAGENAVQNSDDWVVRIISANLNEVAELVRDLNDDDSSCSGIIWFRLPVLGDSLCVSRTAVAKLMRGEAPDVNVTIERRLSENGAIELYLHNDANLSRRSVTITLNWREPTGEFDLSAPFSSATSSLPGLLPTVLMGRAPKPGERLFVGWFRTPSDNLLKTSCMEVLQ